MADREDLGRLVRETWLLWARRQPDPKPSWLTGWDELDEGQREVDCLIGEVVAAAERERIANLAEKHSAGYAVPKGVAGSRRLPFANLIREEARDG